MHHKSKNNPTFDSTIFLTDMYTTTIIYRTIKNFIKHRKNQSKTANVTKFDPTFFRRIHLFFSHIKPTRRHSHPKTKPRKKSSKNHLPSPKRDLYHFHDETYTSSITTIIHFHIEIVPHVALRPCFAFSKVSAC